MTLKAWSKCLKSLHTAGLQPLGFFARSYVWLVYVHWSTKSKCGTSYLLRSLSAWLEGSFLRKKISALVPFLLCPPHPPMLAQNIVTNWKVGLTLVLPFPNFLITKCPLLPFGESEEYICKYLRVLSHLKMLYRGILNQDLLINRIWYHFLDCKHILTIDSL